MAVDAEGREVHVKLEGAVPRSFLRDSRAAPLGRLLPLPSEVHAMAFPSVAPGHVLRFGTTSDGSCFYHSIAAALNVKGVLTKSQRERAQIGRAFRCSFRDAVTKAHWEAMVKEFPQHRDQSFADFRRDICRPNVWATNSFIKLAAMLLDLNIMFIDTRTQEFFCGFAGEADDDHDTVLIVWLNKRHFEPILIIEDASEDSVTVRGRFTRRDHGDILAGLRKAFTQQCGSDWLRRDA